MFQLWHLIIRCFKIETVWNVLSGRSERERVEMTNRFELNLL